MTVDFDILAALTADGPLTLRVTGDCMRGTIPRDAAIQVERRRYYAPGDVVTFGRGLGGIVTHRALGYLPGRSGWRLITRADGAAVADAPVPVDRVLGCVTRVAGQEYRPALQDRVRSVLAWPGAVLAWWRRRLAG